MASSTISSSWATSPTASFSTVSLLPSSAPMRDIEADIKEFWGSFPCPPPWKPRLLIEVNASRLAPHVSKTLQSFLAGKCDIEHVLAGFDLDPDHDLGDQGRGSVDLHSTGTPDPGSSLGSPATSEHEWCDITCEVAIGCAIFFVIVAMVVAVLVCVTRHRVRHKMASTRPSRQQLQLSTSTSDAANCTEFSNLEIQGDDDLIYPPFRHRGLPNPPTACHPSCDPKWNCPNCSPCHPLMRMSPPGQYYSRAYSAVYETIDDDDEDTPRGDNENPSQTRGMTPVKNDSRNPYHSCIPCPMSPTGVSTVQFRPSPHDNFRDGQQMAETGFNGDETLEKASRSGLPPKYFELEHNCALSGPHLHDSVAHNHNQHLANIPALNVSSGECYNIAFSSQGPLVSLSPCQYPNLVGTPLHSFVMSQAQHNALPSANELYKVKTAQDASQRSNDSTAIMAAGTGSSNTSQHVHSYHRNTDGATAPFYDVHHNCYDCGTGVHNLHHAHGVRGSCHFNHNSNSSSHTCAATSSFLADLPPNHYYCHSCQQSSAAQLANFQREMAAPQQGLEGPQFQDSSVVTPDLLNEASTPPVRAEQGSLTPASPTDDSAENNEVPLRKPVLALHSQYFAKTSAA